MCHCIWLDFLCVKCALESTCCDVRKAHMLMEIVCVPLYLTWLIVCKVHSGVNMWQQKSTHALKSCMQKCKPVWYHRITFWMNQEKTKFMINYKLKNLSKNVWWPLLYTTAVTLQSTVCLNKVRACKVESQLVIYDKIPVDQSQSASYPFCENTSMPVDWSESMSYLY